MSDVRHVFAACSHVRGAHIHMEGVGWSNVHFEKATQLPFVREGLHIKPHSVDLRKYFTFKWVRLLSACQAACTLTD